MLDRHVFAIGRIQGTDRQTVELSHVCAYCGEPLSDLDRVRLERGARISHGAHVACMVDAGFPAPDGPDGEAA